MQSSSAPARPGYKVQKIYEARDPLLILTVRAGAPERRRLVLIISAQPRTPLVRITEDKPEGLKPDGALASIMRKYCPTPYIPGFLRGQDQAVWAPLFAGPDQAPRYWLRIGPEHEREISLIDAEAGISLVRRTAGGTFTKRAQALQLPPAWPPGPEFSHFAGVDENTTRPGPEGAPDLVPDQAGAGQETAPATSPLPLYQRQARDSLARRLKTLRKSVSRHNSVATDSNRLPELVRSARLLAAHLHKAREGDHELEVTDPETGERQLLTLDPDQSPGKLLNDMHLEIKKLQRSVSRAADESRKASGHMERLEQDLAKLRTAPLSMEAVTAILDRHGLAPRPARTQRADEPARARPWREFRVRPADDAPEFLILVGRTAQNNDELTRQAKGNDLWLHACGVTGSHVIIPSHQLRGEAPAGLLRQAAILALHYSPLRQNLSGEVYVTRRQFLKKRKGLAPGLWLIDKAETMFVKYSEQELAALDPKKADGKNAGQEQ